MNYTDEQIKQALKCCGEDACEECPMNFTRDDIGCELYVGQLYLLALDVINRLAGIIDHLVANGVTVTDQGCDCAIPDDVVFVEDGDNLVKEMAGEGE